MRLLNLLSGSAAALLLLGGCYENRNKSIELMNRGVEMARQKLYDSALRDLKAATETDPSNYVAWANLGAVFKDQKKWEDCAGAFAQASKLQDGNAEYHYEWGNALQEAKKNAEAKLQYEQALKINARLFKAHFRLATVLEALDTQQGLKDADAEYRKAIEVNPRFVESFNHLGYLYLDHDYTKEAVQVFSEGVKINDSDGELHLGLGRALQANKQYEEAVKEFKKALEKNGDLFVAVYDLGMTYKMMDDRKNAKEYLQRFVQNAGSKGTTEMVKAATDAIYQLDAP